MQKQSTLPVLSQSAGLSQYIREIQKFPMLDAEEEYMLAKRYAEHQDMSAAHRLVTSHLRLVVKIAQSFKGYGLPLAEMISEGSIGLMQAVKKFDPDRGFRLSTYAIWWIKAAMQEYVLRSWSLVKVGTSLAHKKLFFNLKRIKSRIMDHDNGRDLRPEEVAEIARDLDVSEEDVIDMNQRMIASDRYLDAPVSHNSEDNWMAMLEDYNDNHEVVIHENQEKSRRHDMMTAAMQHLSERERDILARRRLQEPPATLEELSQEFSISRERVRQIENRAFEKLQQRLLPSAA